MSNSDELTRYNTDFFDEIEHSDSESEDTDKESIDEIEHSDSENEDSDKESIDEIDFEFLDMCMKNDLEKVKINYISILHDDIYDRHLNSPLMIAIENNYYDMVVFFLEKKLDTLKKNSYGNNSLMIACLYNYIPIIKLLLTHSIQINEKDIYGDNALHLLCKHNNNLEIIKLMVEKYNFDINSTNKSNNTCIMTAIINKNISLATYFLSRDDLILEIKNDLEKTALNLACCYGNQIFIKSLLDRGADYNTVDIEGNTCLIKAVTNGNIDVLQILKDYNIFTEHKNNSGDTALSLACKLDNYYVAQYLIEHLNANILTLDDVNSDLLMLILSNTNYNAILFDYIFDKLIKNTGYSINRKNSSGTTILMLAAELNDLPIVVKLMENKANFHTKNSDGDSCLTIAVTHGCFNVIEYFFNKFSKNPIYARSIVNTADLEGNTLIIIACKKKYYKIARYLINKNCDIDIIAKKDILGVGPLHLAVINNDFKMVKILVENNADLNIKSVSNETPIYFASKFGYVTIFRYLINKGCNIEETYGNFYLLDSEADRPQNVKLLLEKGYSLNSTIKKFGIHTDIPLLTFYVMTNNLDMVEYLLKKGADVNVLDINENIPLNHACVSKNIHMIDLLIKSGSDLNLKNIFGETPIYIVIKMFDINVVAYFIENSFLNINSKDENGRTMLFNFCMQEYIETYKFLDFLINNDILVDEVDNFGHTTLQYVCKQPKSSSSIILKLLSCGANPNIKDSFGNTPLFHSILHNRTTIVNEMIERYSGDINSLNNDSDTLLIFSAIHNNNTLVEYFVKKNININHQNIYGNTALIIAAGHNKYKICKLLIENYADYTLQRYDDKNAAYDVTDNYKILHLMGHKSNAELLEEKNYVDFCKKNKINITFVNNIDIEEDACSICASFFSDREKINDKKCKLLCSHIFCLECILNWYYKCDPSQKNCPICRCDIKNITSS